MKYCLHFYKYLTYYYHFFLDDFSFCLLGLSFFWLSFLFFFYVCLDGLVGETGGSGVGSTSTTMTSA